QVLDLRVDRLLLGQYCFNGCVEGYGLRGVGIGRINRFELLLRDLEELGIFGTLADNWIRMRCRGCAIFVRRSGGRRRACCRLKLRRSDRLRDGQASEKSAGCDKGGYCNENYSKLSRKSHDRPLFLDWVDANAHETPIDRSGASPRRCAPGVGEAGV